MESLLEKVVSLDYSVRGGGDRWRSTDEHSSLVLDLKEQLWYWNSKGLSGKPIDYLLLIKKLPKKQAEELIKDLSGVSAVSKTFKTVTSTPNEKLVKIFWENGKKDRDYWYKRQLTDSTVDLFRLGKYDGFFLIPIYFRDEFINFQCRREEPKKIIIPWYKGTGPVLYNSSILPLLTTVFITEGPVDAILLNQLGYPAVSHTGGAYGWQNDWFSFFSNIKKVYYIADNDKVGFLAAKKVASCLGEHKVKIVLFNTDIEKYDTIDFFRDGNTVQEFEKLVDSSKYLFELNKEYFGGKR
jgi:DNA primase